MALKSNPGVQSDVAKTPAGSASIGGTSATVVAANPARVEVTIVNTHATQTADLALGATAVAGTGIRLNAAGGSYTTKSYTGIITAIASGAGTTLQYSEV
jgi:hypothetical protein